MPVLSECHSELPDLCSDSNTPPKKSMNAFRSDRPSSCAVKRVVEEEEEEEEE